MPEFAPNPSRLLYALRRAHLAVEVRKQAALSELGLLPAHYAVLITVWAHPGTTGAELARHLGVTPQNVANLVGKLVRRGLLRRDLHATHRHVLELQLTEDGMELLRAADQRVALLEEQVVGVLGEQDAARIVEGLLAIAHQPVDTL